MTLLADLALSTRSVSDDEPASFDIANAHFSAVEEWLDELTDITAKVENGVTTVTVPRASGNGSQVLFYLVNITDETGNIVAENHKYINDLLITAQEEDMADPVTLGLGLLSAGHTYTIKVTACNVWGTQGDSLTATVSL